MNVLALYGSSHGQAEAVLKRIVVPLEARGHRVTLTKGNALPRDFRMEDFDAVVIAASIIVGRYQPYVSNFVSRHVDRLNSIPSAFVSVSSTAPESSPAWRAAAERYVEGLLQPSGWRPRWTATFAGALRYTQYGILTRWIMKRISRKHGGPTDTSRDHEYTDWEAVDRFAEQLADELEPQRD